MKKMNPKTLCKILAVLVLVLAVVAGWALKEREDYRRQLAEENLQAWYCLYWDMEGMILPESPEDMQQVKNSAEFIYFTRGYSEVIPGLMGTNIGGDYMSLVYNLVDGSYSGDSFTEEELEEGVAIFRDMTEELKQFSLSVIKRSYKDEEETIPDWNFRKGLLDYDSKVYRQVSNEITELAAKYDKILKEFYKIWIVVD